MATLAKPTGATLPEMSEAKRRLLEQRLRGVAQAAPVTIPRREADAQTPISIEQHRIWLHAAMEPEVPIYNEALTVHRRGSFDRAVFEASFNEILRRHEVWRTSFALEGDEVVQVIAPELTVTLPLTDISGLDVGEREVEALRLAAEDAATPVEMTRAPLFRVRLLRVAADDHRLLLTLHHIIFDGVSLYRTFVPELAAVYATFAEGRPSPLPEPALQYADYTVWKQRQLESPGTAKHLEYWRRELAGELPVLRLPLDRPRPAAMSHHGGMETLAIPEEVMAGLRRLSREQGVTLYMTLLAALKVLFFRYSGQEDVIVGGLADGRRRPELDRVMGYFLDTFAIRTRPRAELPFAVYLREVRTAVLGALAAAEVPFSRVLSAVQPVRERNHHPIFQTFLAFQPQAEPFPEGWDLSKTNINPGAAKFDLYIEVDERPGHAAMRLMYRTDLFDAATIQRMAAHWQTLLRAVTEMPDCLLGDLPVLTADERTLMLVDWNATARAMPEETLHGLVEAQAKRTPDAVAVVFEGISWSYKKLDEEANRLAGQLRLAGAVRGALVAVCLERSQYLLSSLLAILKTGAAYLPLDPGTPRARRMLCLEDAAPAVVLTERALVEDLPPSSGAVVVLEEALAAGHPDRRMDGSEVLELEDAAYVIHTSGSTGRPKAVEISHRALVNLLVSMQREPGFTAKDTLLAVTTISFDIAGLELFLPLLAGGKVVIARRAVALDPVLLAAAVTLTGCTVLQATPATWRALLGSGWKGRPGLRVLCGGEAMTRDLADTLLALGLEVWNVYGPTETTIWSTTHRVTAGVGAVSVGRPVANTTAYILDARQQPVPVGVGGELYLGGNGLANGYRGQPELTAQKFVVLAWTGFSDSSPGRLYRTGDYALFRANGTIEVQGRADNQVKVRGYRIELEDVESALARHPDVAMGAAKAWPDAAGGNRLSAYLVGRPGVRPPDAAELREFLKSRVPEYMIPSDVVALEAMPLTPNGKMDRKALVAPVARVERAIAVAPATEHERRLAGLWAELLGVSAIGMDDNFFDLGGHSLLVARLQHRIGEEFAVKLPMAAIYHAPTLRLQTGLLSASGTGQDMACVLPIQPLGSEPPLFWLEPTPLIGNLGKALGETQPLLGVTMTRDELESLGPEPGIEAIAGCYARTILKARPRGPYRIGGLCLQGILAYEVAGQILAAGHAVETLIMLDAENPVFYRRFDTFATEWAKFWFYSRRALLGNGGPMFRRHVRSRVRRLLRMKKAADTEMSTIDSATLSAVFPYQPPVYGGDVLLIIPRDRPPVVDYRRGWQGLVGGRLTCVEVDAHHDELLDSARAGGVAKAIEGYLVGAVTVAA